jgi:hypothetical protein
MRPSVAMLESLPRCAGILVGPAKSAKNFKGQPETPPETGFTARLTAADRQEFGASFRLRTDAAAIASMLTDALYSFILEKTGVHDLA